MSRLLSAAALLTAVPVLCPSEFSIAQTCVRSCGTMVVYLTPDLNGCVFKSCWGHTVILNWFVWFSQKMCVAVFSCDMKNHLVAVTFPHRSMSTLLGLNCAASHQNSPSEIYLHGGIQLCVVSLIIFYKLLLSESEI